mgnify:FL=1
MLVVLSYLDLVYAHVLLFNTKSYYKYIFCLVGAHVCTQLKPHFY